MSALVEIPVPSPVAAPWGAKLGGLSRAQMLRLALGVAAFLAVVVVGVVMGRQAEWRVLYANLADKDGGAIVAQLSQMNVPYQHAPGGGAILVPADRVYDTRLRLASLGLPKGSVTGFELMDTSRFGMTQFQERLTFQRGLEGELTRSIQALSSVQSARVHLALPNQNGFFREQQKASASVLLGLHPGRSLERAQLAGIVHLVASSVPEMNPSAVSVLDDTGKLLSNPPDGTAGAVDAQQLQYVQQLEQQYSRRILDILEPVVGRNNVRAQVTAEVDFSQTESTSESHKPNQTADAAAIRSQQVSEAGAGAGAGSTPPAGVPGATTNQPPAPSSAPINGASAPLSAGGAAPLGAGAKRESIINYEVDKTTRVVRGASGVIKRLSAAVVVNYQTNPEEKGKPVARPLSEQQIEKMTALARESIGFSKDRGDSVNLMNAPFAVEKTNLTELPLWKQPEVQDLAHSLAWPVGTLLLGALMLMGFVRPALKAVGTAAREPVTAPAGGQLSALVADDTARALLPPPGKSREPQPPTMHELRLTDARQLARENPMAVANIVKTWVNGEAAA